LRVVYKIFLQLFFAGLFVFSISQVEATAKELLIVSSKPRMISLETSMGRQKELLRLTEHPDAQAAKKLVQALKDPDPEIRYAAVWVIETINIEASARSLLIDSLLDLLKKENNPWVLTQTIIALRRLETKKKEDGLQLDSRGLDTLLVLSKNPDPFIRSAAVESLSLWKRDERVQRIQQQAFQAATWLIRRASGWYLRVDQSAQGIELLEQALRDEDRNIRLAAIDILRNLKHPQVIPLLTERLYDEDGQVVFETIIFLRASRDPKAVKPLLDFAAYKKQWEPQITTAIEEITGQPYNDVKKDHKPTNQEAGRKAPINRIDSTLEVQKAKAGSIHERITAVMNLAWSETPEAIEALLNALNDQDARVRYAAAEALGANYVSLSRNTEPVIHALFDAALDPNRFVRMKVAEVLRNFKMDEIIRSRIADFLRDRIAKEKDPFVKAEIIKGVKGWEKHF